MERVLSRETSAAESYDSMDRWKVCIIGISEGAGVSFLTGCLARYLTNTGKHNPAVVELGKGSFYDSIGMDKRFSGRSWFRFFQAVNENQSLRGMRNMDEGINWVIRSPGEGGAGLTFEQQLRLITHARGDVILCDLSGEPNPNWQMLHSMDKIVAVIDPMPSKMLEGYIALSNLKAMENGKREILFVINKMNNGVNRRQMLDYLNIKKPVFLPLVNPESLYTAEYNCKIPYSVGEVRNTLQTPLGEIASALFL